MDAQVTTRLVALGATGTALHQPTLVGLQHMLHDHNTFVQRFKQVMDMLAHDLPQWEVVIRVDGNVDKCRYNAPIAPEMAGLLPREVLWQHINHTQKTFIFLKMWNSKILKIQIMFQSCFKISNFQKCFTTHKWVIMYMMYEEKS
jgi:hypothetical protein